MSTGAKQVMIDDWQYLYKRALASVSSKNMSQRVASAEKAIIMKLGHLRADSGESPELLALLDALAALRALKCRRLMSWLGPVPCDQKNHVDAGAKRA